MRQPYARSDLLEWKSYRTPRERLLEAIIAVADADADDDGAAYHRAWCRFRRTLLDLGWTPPRNEEGERQPPAADLDPQT